QRLSGGTPTPSHVSSFRDPGGALVRSGDRLYRIVTAAAVPDLEAFLGSKLAHKLNEKKALPTTRRLSAEESAELRRDEGFRSIYEAIGGAAVLEHERIGFPSFPYEWPAEMLHAAAELTLDLARWGLKEGIGLKDATPLNVIFRGP